MDKITFYAIYKYDFHKATEQSIEYPDEGIDGTKNLPMAQACFASLFDPKTIDNLVKFDQKAHENRRLPNDVMADKGDFIFWRVNNSQIKELWKLSGKDGSGIDKYEKDELESNPFGHVLIDNRPGVCMMAIEKSSSWGNNPDTLRDLILNNFNHILRAKYDLEMRIEAKMNPTDVWTFVRERLYEHDDYINKIQFTFQNPQRINKSNAMEVKSRRLKSIINATAYWHALRGSFSMTFDKDTNDKINKKNRDLAEMVNLCSDNGYDISITFKDFKTYRINDYVKAYFKMETRILDEFRSGQLTLTGTSDLEEWFNRVENETKSYLNESQIPKRRHPSRK